MNTSSFLALETRQSRGQVWREAWRRFSRGKLAGFGLLVVLFTITIAFAALLLASADPTAVSRDPLFVPSVGHFT